VNQRQYTFIQGEMDLWKRYNKDPNGFYIPMSEEQRRDLTRRADALDYWPKRAWRWITRRQSR